MSHTKCTGRENPGNEHIHSLRHVSYHCNLNGDAHMWWSYMEPFSFAGACVCISRPPASCFWWDLICKVTLALMYQLGLLRLTLVLDLSSRGCMQKCQQKVGDCLCLQDVACLKQPRHHATNLAHEFLRKPRVFVYLCCVELWSDFRRRCTMLEVASTSC